jgi:hypothetical protein
MAKDGEVNKLRGRAGYVHLERTDLNPEGASNFDNQITSVERNGYGQDS